MKNAFFAAAACLLLVFCCSAGHVHSAAESVGGWGDCGLKHAEEAPVADDGGDCAAATPTRPCLTICCWPGGAAARGMAACPESAITGAWSVMTGR